MSSIKPKIGYCIDCGRNMYLTAKRCQICYKKHRSKINADKPAKKAKDVQKKVFGVYFANQAHKIPLFCEETGQRLPTYPQWLKRSCMAHILPKRKDFGFDSVALHPYNMVFVMPEIHQNMDNLGKEYIMNMKIYPILKERIQVLLPLLTQQERNKVPEYLISK